MYLKKEGLFGALHEMKGKRDRKTHDISLWRKNRTIAKKIHS
jgi:hypothetical protein